MSDLATEYREAVRLGLGEKLGAERTSVRISDDLAALCFAKDLMKGNPEQFKVGYSAENAVLSALEVFPNANLDKLRVALVEIGVANLEELRVALVA